MAAISTGNTCTILDECPTAAGTKTKDFVVESDSVLASLWIESISGDLDVVITTLDDTGQELDVITFPTQSAPTSNILLRKAGTTLSKLKVTVTYTDAVKYRVTIRAINSGSGDTSIKVSGADDASASQTTVGTSATLLIPSALTDRAGLVLKNANAAGGDVLYVGFSAAQASTAVGYPLQPGEALAMDVAAGVSVYGAAGSSTVDVRILEAGG